MPSIFKSQKYTFKPDRTTFLTLGLGLYFIHFSYTDYWYILLAVYFLSRLQYAMRRRSRRRKPKINLADSFFVVPILALNEYIYNRP